MNNKIHKWYDEQKEPYRFLILLFGLILIPQIIFMLIFGGNTGALVSITWTVLLFLSRYKYLMGNK